MEKEEVSEADGEVDSEVDSEADSEVDSEADSEVVKDMDICQRRSQHQSPFQCQYLLCHSHLPHPLPHLCPSQLFQ